MSQRNTRSIGGVYRVGQLLATDGALTTYTAYDQNTNDVVGLFIIEVPTTIPPATLHQILQPLQKRRSAQSPHLIRVHSWGIDGAQIYIATDPPRGVTLQHVLDNENVDFARALNLSQQLADGLKILHDHGIAGLDLRPQFITVDSVGITDRVQIDDIGLRMLLNTLGYINNQPGNDISYLDPRYAAPEYINHGPIGPWSDIYQVGLLLFTMITGRLPFVGRNPAETGIMQSNDPIPRMSQYKHDTPEVLQNLIHHAMAKELGSRFTNASALGKALEGVQLPHAASIEERASELPSTPPSAGLTREMSELENIALRDTLIEGYPSSPLESDLTIRANEPPETGVYAYLLYEQQGEAPQRLPIKQKSVIIGRIDPKRGLSPDIDLSTLDSRMTISRQHARIHFEETFFYIEDLKSRNKTRLGELPLKPLQAELLQHGDVLHFGSVRLRFEVSGRGHLPPLKESHA